MARQSIPLKSIVLYFFIFFLTIGAVSLGAQTPPPWTPITGNQYNMVALGNVYRNGVLLSGSGYWVGTCGPGGLTSDCRSVGAVNTSGQYYSTIRGDADGDTIHFFIWEGSTGLYFEAAETLSFLSDDLKTGFDLHYAAVLCTISGTVTWNGSPLAGVTLSGFPIQAVTNASGQYSAVVNAGWSGTVIPTLAGFAFDPPNRAYSAVVSNQTGQDYTGTTDKSVQLLSPNGFENWQAGSVHRIAWNTTGTFTGMRIDYSTNGGSTWTQVAASAPNSGYFDWTVPNAPSAACLVRVSDPDVPAIGDTSNDNFSIVASLPAFRGFADFDGDGICDLFWRDYDIGGTQGSDRLWIMNTYGQASSVIQLPTESDLLWEVGGVNDLNRDGVPDIFWRYYGTGADQGKNRVWYMKSDGTLKGTENLPSLSDLGWRMSGIGDVNNDQVPDILWRHYGSGADAGKNKVWFMNDDGTVKSEAQLDTVADLAWTIVGVADFDRDGRADLLWRYYGEGTYKGWNSIWYLNANGSVKGTAILSTVPDLNWKPGAVGNGDGDAIPDIFWRYYGEGTYQGWNSVWYMHASGQIKDTRIIASNTDLSWTMVNNGLYVDVGLFLPSVTLQRPNGGEVLTVGSIFTIMWLGHNGVGSVKLEYSTNNGSGWTEIASSLATNGSYDWTVPNTLSTQCLMRVSEMDGDPTDTSDATFAIAAAPLPSITVVSPNGGETLYTGNVHSIRWTSTGSVGNVKIDYSTDAGTGWTPVVASTGNTGSYTWTVPSTLSSQCLVRVEELDGSPTDTSDATFTIATAPLESIALTTPNGFENWLIGSVHRITWNYTGAFTNVKVEYSTNGGSTWTQVIASTTNSGYFDWTVPSAASANCRVRVSDAALPAVNDMSNANFAIVSSLPAYRGFGDFNNDGICDLLWRYYDSGPSQGQNQAWMMNAAGTVLATPSLQLESSLNWRIGGVADLNRDGFSDVFWRYQGVGADQGKNRVWYLGSNGTLLGTENLLPLSDPGWKMSGVGDVNNDQVPDIVWRNYGTGADAGKNKVWIMADDGRMLAEVPCTAVADLAWTIVGVADFDRDGRSDLLWRYYGEGTYKGYNSIWYLNADGTTKGTRLLTTVADLNWKPGAVGDANGDGIPDIYWRYYGTGTYQGWNSIWYLRADGSVLDTRILTTNSDLAWTMVNNGTCLWSGPVVPTITIISPNGGETLYVGTAYHINWTSTGSVGNVKIDYSTDAGTGWTPVVASTGNTGSYTWTVPSTLSSQCLVRVSELDDDPLDVSDGTFTIATAPAESIALTSPNGYERWLVGSVHRIAWSYTGAFTHVLIEYSTNGGSSWIQVIASAPNLGYYDWTVPAAASANCRVRMSDAALPSVNDASDANFSIVTTLPSYKGYADFNNDGICDLFWRYYATGTYQGWNSVWNMNAYGNILTTPILPVESDLNWRIGGVGDLNRDGVPDIFWRYYGAGVDQGRNRVWYLKADATILGVEELPVLSDLDWRLSGVGDMDGDQVMDIVWRNYGAGADQGKNRIWYLYDDGSLKGTKDLMTVADTGWTIVGIGDLDRDGRSDLFWRYQATGSYQGWNSVWLMNTDGTMKDARMLPNQTDLNWRIGGVGDSDGDGVPDLLWRNYSTGADQVWYLYVNGNLKDTKSLTAVSDTGWTLVNGGGRSAPGQ